MRACIRNILQITAILLVMAGCGEREVSFSKDVFPILRANCVECHSGAGEGVVVSGLNLEDYGGLRQGTRFGPVIVAGDSTSSTLYRAVSHQVDLKIQMPPHHKEALPAGRKSALTEEQIIIIRNWIDQGAINN